MIFVNVFYMFYSQSPLDRTEFSNYPLRPPRLGEAGPNSSEASQLLNTNYTS